MNPQMYARLDSAIKKWWKEELNVTKGDETLDSLSAWWPEKFPEPMSKSAALIFDATLNASKFAEEQEQEP